MVDPPDIAVGGSRACWHNPAAVYPFLYAAVCRLLQLVALGWQRACKDHEIRRANANAFCERWIGTARAEWLDWVLVFGRKHLEWVLRTYVRHYNEARLHRGLGFLTPRVTAQLGSVR